MKLSPILLLAVAFVVLQCFSAEGEAAAHPLAGNKKPKPSSVAKPAAAVQQQQPAQARGARARKLANSNKAQQPQPHLKAARTGRKVQRPKGRNGRQEGDSAANSTAPAAAPVANATAPAAPAKVGDKKEAIPTAKLADMMKEGPKDAIEAEALKEAVADAMMPGSKKERRDAVDANGDGVPDWCNPIKPMGAWLNFRNMRAWCSNKGFTNFGPYGGAPSANGTAPAAPAPATGGAGGKAPAAAAAAAAPGAAKAAPGAAKAAPGAAKVVPGAPAADAAPAVPALAEADAPAEADAAPADNAEADV